MMVERAYPIETFLAATRRRRLSSKSLFLDVVEEQKWLLAAPYRGGMGVKQVSCQTDLAWQTTATTF
jgi:hypothetical protein